MNSVPRSSNTGSDSGTGRRKIFDIETFSLRFDFREDRLRLDATDRTGRLLGLWLTQRLANKLIATLTKDLDREVTPPPEVSRDGAALNVTKSQEPSIIPQSRELTSALHEIAQHRMRAERTQYRADIERGLENDARPVILAGDTVCWLCTTIRLGPKPRGVLISFSGEDQHLARFFMSFRNARRVLDGLAGHYGKAGWPLDAFPEWVRNGKASAAEQGQGRVLN